MKFGPCRDCVFYVYLDDDDEGEEFGTCHRYPPVYVKEDPRLVPASFPQPPGLYDPREWLQPSVRHYGSCGEFCKDGGNK